MTDFYREAAIAVCKDMIAHYHARRNPCQVSIWQRALDSLRDAEEDLDLDLLAKLASGEGGRRTGALKRAGYLEWTVTEAGQRALGNRQQVQ
jgi:hypothetical protein